ncbi:hypothetical protein Tco_0440617, partial [Tanacetum coccineum]
MFDDAHRNDDVIDGDDGDDDDDDDGDYDYAPAASMEGHGSYDSSILASNYFLVFVKSHEVNIQTSLIPLTRILQVISSYISSVNIVERVDHLLLSKGKRK